MKTLKIASILSMLTLSANAGFFLQAGLGMEKGKFNPEAVESTIVSPFTLKTEIETSATPIQLGLGYSWNFNNNFFTRLELNYVSMKADEEKKDAPSVGGNFDWKAEITGGFDFGVQFGYKINDKFSTYAKLGYGSNNIENVEVDQLKIIEGDVGGLLFGLGGAYNFNAKSSIYLEVLMKDYKGDDGKLIAGGFDFDTSATYKATNLTVGYRYFF